MNHFMTLTALFLSFSTASHAACPMPFNNVVKAACVDGKVVLDCPVAFETDDNKPDLGWSIGNNHIGGYIAQFDAKNSPCYDVNGNHLDQITNVCYLSDSFPRGTLKIYAYKLTVPSCNHASADGYLVVCSGSF